MVTELEANALEEIMKGKGHVLLIHFCSETIAAAVSESHIRCIGPVYPAVIHDPALADHNGCISLLAIPGINKQKRQRQQNKKDFFHNCSFLIIVINFP
jgi:hypothetical protein